MNHHQGQGHVGGLFAFTECYNAFINECEKEALALLHDLTITQDIKALVKRLCGNGMKPKDIALRWYKN